MNTLAELASHKNRRVRLRCCEMLAYFLVCLPDRYDHQQRLLPYILSFASDGNKNIQNTALSCIEKCGLQYEREHPDEIIERRQLGVDGEDTIDYNSGLPNPFTRRPSLGARQYVRANTARFFLAVLGELSSWKEETRKRSLDLLMILVVYCEEHLTKDFQHSINLFAKAIGVQKQAKDGNSSLLTVERFEEVLQLMGKYVDPSVYLPLISPRITGDNSSGTSNAEDGSHSEKTRSIYAFILSSLIKGAPLLRIIPHWLNIASILSNSNCIGPYAGTKIQEEILNAFLSLIVRVGASKKERSIFLSYFADTCNQTKLKSAINESLVNLMNSSDVLGSNSALAKACTESLLKIVSAIDQNAA